MRRILVVDDEAELRNVLTEFLAKACIAEVQQAASGDEAMLLLQGGATPKLLVTDLRMPGMSGLDLIRRAKAAHPTLRVLAITGEMEDQRALARDAGADEVLRKPFDFKALEVVALRLLSE